MKSKRCGGAENNPDKQENVTGTVKTADGCEDVHVDMGTGAVTYTPAKEGKCGCGKKDGKK